MIMWKTNMVWADHRHCRSPRRSLAHDRGAGTVLIAVAILIVAVVAAVCLCLVGWIGADHRARAAADLAALAGADAYAAGTDACSSATQVADVNHATLTDCSVETNSIDFIVKVSVQVPAHPDLPGGPQSFTQTAYAGSVTT
jgi:secretion/DNA translocation related TadE-like protein